MEFGKLKKANPKAILPKFSKKHEDTTKQFKSLYSESMSGSEYYGGWSIKGIQVFKKVKENVTKIREDEREALQKIEKAVARRLLEADLAEKKRKAQEAGVEFKEPKTKKSKVMKQNRQEICTLLDDMDDEE